MITNLSATEIAQSIRSGNLSPVQVVDAHIAHIEAVNPSINAVVITTFEKARQRAKEAEAALNHGELWGPLHGVPFTVKDGFEVGEGVPDVCGLVSRVNNRSTQESPLVRRMREAGAILLGKTNVPDNSSDMETINIVFGPTRNPWNLTRSAGGSSGGEGAIIAAGGSPLGLGSDIGGSIRVPSAFTGIVGLRPTGNLLSVEHFWPPLHAGLDDLVALGPMARRVEDVALAFDVLCNAQPHTLNPDALRDQKVACWYSDGLVPSSSAVRGGVSAAVKALTGAGMVATPGAVAARRLASIGRAASIKEAERKAWAQGFGNGETWSPLAELGRTLIGNQRVASGSLLMWLLMNTVSRLTNQLGINGTRWREQIHRQLAELIGEQGIVVCPVFPFTAPRLGWTVRWMAVVTLSSFTTWVNLAGLPSLTLPVGFSSCGMPVGIQIVGNRGSEHTLLAAGLVIQQALMPQWIGPYRESSAGQH
ncbi:MAG: amidase [Chloroflexota bacterium]